MPWPLPKPAGPARLAYDGRDAQPDALPTPPLVRFEQHGDASPRGRLVRGDLPAVLGGLLAAGAAGFDLAYLDPPFDTDRPWRRRVRRRGPRADQRAVDLEVPAYHDRWTGDGYLAALHGHLRATHAALGPEGVLVLHCDARRAHHLRALCEEVFGPAGFVNEVVWRRRPGRANTGRRLDQVSDRMLIFAKGRNHFFARPFSRDDPDAQAYIAERFTGREPDGRRFMTAPLSSPNPRANLRYEYEGHRPPPNGWAISRDKMAAWHAAGRLHFVPGGRIYRKVYLDEYPGRPVTDLWADLPPINAMAGERLGFPTQKPLALLHRVLDTFCPAGGSVLEGFAGAGTATIAAAASGRRFVAVDRSHAAVRLTALRLAWSVGRAVPFGLDAADAQPATASSHDRLRALREDGGVRLDRIDLPDLADRVGGVDDPRVLLVALAAGPVRDGVHHVTCLDAPRDPEQLVEGRLRATGPGLAVRATDVLFRDHVVELAEVTAG
jgi:hypothetical protein